MGIVGFHSWVSIALSSRGCSWANVWCRLMFIIRSRCRRWGRRVIRWNRVEGVCIFEEIKRGIDSVVLSWFGGIVAKGIEN